MSFGFSIGDAILLSQLARRTYRNARKACGEHHELTTEVRSLHAVLHRLQQEAIIAENPINRLENTCCKEIELLTDGCQTVLHDLNTILRRNIKVSAQQGSLSRLLKRIQFGNGQMADLGDLRAKLTFYTSALSLSLNMVSMGSIGRVETQMDGVGNDLRTLKVTINSVAVRLHSDGSACSLTDYSGDDRKIWKQLRRELIKEGVSSATLRRNKARIKEYMKELGDRALFDQDSTSHEQSVPRASHSHVPAILPTDSSLSSDDDDAHPPNINIFATEDAANLKCKHRRRPHHRSNPGSYQGRTDELETKIREAKAYMARTRNRVYTEPYTTNETPADPDDGFPSLAFPDDPHCLPPAPMPPGFTLPVVDVAG